ncbi:uncharacterized protein [Oscarella lobularis]|uniref:uncharacterized protein isoform X2 n=1 Tax=Oscarella lobularis TaxID=121494 RepID=UPI0033133B6E
MDERWNTHVRPILHVLVAILSPFSLIDRLYSLFLITREEYERIKAYDSVEASQQLLVMILPRKGPDAFKQFLSVLEETEGQKHVAELIIEEGLKCEQVLAARKNINIERIRELEKELKKEKEEREEKANKLKKEVKKKEKYKKKFRKEKVTNIGFRTKFSMGNPSVKWETKEPNMPVDYCEPPGRVAKINGMLHVGYGNRMFQFKKGAWEGEEYHLPGIKRIRSVFECEGKVYVMDINDSNRCSSIHEWKSETRNLKLFTKIPDKYQLNERNKWEAMKKMKNERFWCSSAVIDDKIETSVD